MPVLGGGGQVHELAVQPRLRAGIGLVVTSQDLDERGLARSVLAHQGVYFAGGDLHGHVIQRLGAGKGLRNAGDPQ
jgi:hypothetical protein